MTTTRKSQSALMYPGLNRIWTGKQDTPSQYAKFFDVRSSSKAYETVAGMTGLSTVPGKYEGKDAVYDDPLAGFYQVFYHLTYGLKFRVTREAMEDDQYAMLGSKQTANLAKSVRATQDILGASIFNNGFTSTVGAPDSVPLYSTSHPLIGGGVYANRPSTNAALSLTSLQAAINTMLLTLDDRSIITSYAPTKLIVPPSLQFLAQQLMQTPRVLGSNNNDVNVIMGRFQVEVWERLSSPTAWFLQCDNADNGLVWYNKRVPEFKSYTDNNTEDAIFGTSFRCSAGQENWRGNYGSPGS